MSDFIVDAEDKIAFRDELGHDIAWDFLDCGDSTCDHRAEFAATYELVKNGSDSWFHTDGDLYQGSTLIRIIRRKSDGKLFGYEFWEQGGKYGGTEMEANGDYHGFPSKYDWQDGIDANEEWYVFLPVELAPLPAYKFVDKKED